MNLLYPTAPPCPTCGLHVCAGCAPQIVLTDAPVPTTANVRLAELLTLAEQMWLARRARKAARAQGTSKYVPHQGRREMTRRKAQGAVKA